MIADIGLALSGLAVAGAIEAFRRRRNIELAEQQFAVEGFVAAAEDVYDDPLISESLKDAFRALSNWIDDARLARRAGEIVEAVRRADFRPHTRNDPEWDALPHEQKERFATAVRCFLIAISYADRKRGYILRGIVAGKDARRAERADFAVVNRLADRYTRKLDPAAQGAW